MHAREVDLNLLVAFDALMAERSVTRAAARIGRTQPAMSHALSRLRALYRDELFVRSPAGLQPTPRAQDLSGPLGDALAQIQRTLDGAATFDAREAKATFTLALSDHPAFVLLPTLVRRLSEAAPNVVLHVQGFADRHRAEELLDQGAAHAAIGVPASCGASVISQPLFQERFVSILRRGHPALAGRWTLQRFLAYPHLLVSPEGDRHGLVDAALARHGLARTLGISLPQMYAAPGIVAESDLIATLMEGVARPFAAPLGLAILAPPIELPTVSFVLAWHRRNDAHPAQRWLRQIIVEVAQQATPAAASGHAAPRTPRRPRAHRGARKT